MYWIEKFELVSYKIVNLKNIFESFIHEDSDDQ
jgi:hypothetical protein